MCIHVKMHSQVEKGINTCNFEEGNFGGLPYF